MVRKEVPWCSLGLATAAILCNVAVLIGNMGTAAVMTKFGDSTAGWSHVGVGLAHSLRTEFDTEFTKLATLLSEGLQHALASQQMMEEILAVTGNQAHQLTATEKTQQLSLLQTSGKEHDAPLNGTHALNSSSIIMQAVDGTLGGLFQELDMKLNDFLARMDPALHKVMELDQKFSRTATGALDSFTSTLDFSQNLLDEGMSKLHGGVKSADSAEGMLHNTFSLFDVSNTGLVNGHDLHEVSRLYGISVLKGNSSLNLLIKHDQDGDAKLTKEEFANFVMDESVPGVMTVILRTYAKRLAEVAGKVGAAKQRDEIAKAVVEYFKLVTAKNKTKVGWIAEALTNGSLPVAFTADVVAEMCRIEDAPMTLSSGSVGGTVVHRMMELNSEGFLAAAELVRNTSFWVAQGWNPQEHGACMARLANWTQKAKPAKGTLIQLQRILGHGSQVPSLTDSDMEGFELMAKESAEVSMSKFLKEMQDSHTQQRSRRFSTEFSQLLLTQVLGTRAAFDVASPSPAEQAIRKAEMAAPETLEFAQWLANNATSNSAIFHDMCFEYSGQSSSKVDSVAAQMRAFSSKAESFIKMMDSHANPSGIQRLRSQVKMFAESGQQQVLKLVKHEVEAVLNSSSAGIDILLRNVSQFAGDDLGKVLAKMVAHPLAKPMASQLVKALMGSNTSAESAPEDLVARFSGALEQQVTNMAGKALGQALSHAAGDFCDALIAGNESAAQDLLRTFAGGDQQQVAELLKKALQDGLGAAVQKHPSSLIALGHALHQQTAAESREVLVGSEWDDIVSQLRSMVSLVPAAQKLLKVAKEEEAKLSQALETQFAVLLTRGPDVFKAIARHWQVVWVVYFLVTCTFFSVLLFYSFWSFGWWEGPEALHSASDDAKSVQERISSCCLCCCYWTCGKHDTDVSFWSLMVMLTVCVLLIFVVVLVLCSVAGVRAILGSGCGQVFVLDDPGLCDDTLSSLRTTLSSFRLGPPSMPEAQDSSLEPQELCSELALTVCKYMKEDMTSAISLTCGGGILSFFFSFQLVLDSAMAHQRVRNRKLI